MKMSLRILAGYAELNRSRPGKRGHVSGNPCRFKTVDATPIKSVHSIMILRQDLPAGAIFNLTFNRALFFELGFGNECPLKHLHLDVELDVASTY
jgi:hypothetical protein